MEADLPDRRLGPRHGDVRFGVGWRVDRVDCRPSPRHPRLPLPPDVGVLLDASLSGASVLARSARELRVGSRTVMSFRGVSGVVIIRRIASSVDPARSVYGIEFAQPKSALTALVNDTFLGSSPKPELSHDDPRRDHLDKALHREQDR